MSLFIEKLESDNDVLRLINIIDYGSTYFICENENVISFLDSCVKVINESLGVKTVRFERETLVDVLEMYEVKNGHGLFKIISSRSREQLPMLSDDSFNIHKFLNEAFNDKKKVYLSLDPSLYGYAKKLAKKDLIFDVDDDGPFFLGVNKELSVYEKIKNAFYSGKESIKFDAKTVSVATVRCYASTLSQMSGNKFRTRIVDGFVTVYFKPLSDKDEAKNKITAILNFLDTKQEKILFLTGLAYEIEANDVIDDSKAKKSEAPKLERKLYGKVVSEEEYINAENWQRLGFASKYNWENDIKGDIDMFPFDDFGTNLPNDFDDDNDGF